MFKIVGLIISLFASIGFLQSPPAYPSRTCFGLGGLWICFGSSTVEPVQTTCNCICQHRYQSIAANATDTVEDSTSPATSHLVGAAITAFEILAIECTFIAIWKFARAGDPLAIEDGEVQEQTVNSNPLQQRADLVRRAHSAVRHRHHSPSAHA